MLYVVTWRVGELYVSSVVDAPTKALAASLMEELAEKRDDRKFHLPLPVEIVDSSPYLDVEPDTSVDGAADEGFFLGSLSQI